MTAITMRQPFQGVLQILEFNWLRYLVTSIFVGTSLCILPYLQPVPRAAMLAIIAPAVFWIVASLLVSHYVYDCFPLYDLIWLSRSLTQKPHRWVNIHCGFDETSPLLAAVFPDATGNVIDIFDPQVMTEASIRRARRMGDPCVSTTHARLDDLGFASATFDAAFCIFAAHELRSHVQRVKLFKEVARVLEVGGEFVVIEHLRDWKNFLAFGPGVLHFFSQEAWRRAAAHAGLAVRAEYRRTPFVHVFILRRTL